MDSKTVISELRRKFSANGWFALIYYAIMTFFVSIIFAIDVVVVWMQYALDPDGLQMDFDQVISDRMIGNGWGHLLACIIIGIILFIWKKPDFCFRQIWAHEKPMSGKAFLVLFCAFLTGQAIQLLLTPVIEWLLNQIGLSALASLESATGSANTVSMFLYVAIFAPVFEEIFFRGLILRNFLPYGKKFAIFATSYLFGVLHGNLLQTPYAFMVGLVLGYTAVEYGLGWSIVLHIFNNFVLGDLVTRLAELIPSFYVDFALYFLFFGAAIATLVLATFNSRKIADYLSSRRMHPWCLKGFFSSWGVIVFSIIMFGNMVALLLV